MTASKNQPTVRLSRPRVRLLDVFPATCTLDTGPWAIDFGDGLVAHIDRYDEGFGWLLFDSENIAAEGLCHTPKFAFLELWCRAARLRPPPAIGLSELDVQRFVRKTDAGVAEAAETIRDLLRRRTGFAWSVRRGRGDARDTLTIKASPKRCADGVMSVHDAALLAAITGEEIVTPRSGVRVTPERRAEIVRAIAGPATIVASEERCA